MTFNRLTLTMLLAVTAASGQRAVRHASARMHFDGTRSGAGQVMAWGNNTLAQAGGGSLLPFLTPTRLNMTGAVAVAGGTGHSLVLEANGGVRAFGADDVGQLGDGPTSQLNCTQGLACAVNTRVLRPDGSGAFPDAVAIAAGTKHSLILNASGEVFAFGLNSTGQLGNPVFSGGAQLPVAVSGVAAGTTLRGIKAIAAGTFHSMALGSDGILYTWGDDSAGQLGNGAVTGVQTRPVSVLKNVAAIAAGARFGLVLHSDGSVSAWGDNSSGQLGIGSTVSQTSPVRIPGLRRVKAIAAGTAHALALTSDGKVWVWGSDADEQIGNGFVSGTQMSPVQTTVTGGMAIAAGLAHSVVLLADGTMVSWGRNGSGQVGNGTIGTNVSVPVPVGQNRAQNRILAIGAGGEHSLAVFESDQAFQTNGVAAGVPASATGGVAQLTAVTAGTGYALAILHDGRGVAWGASAGVGEMGIGFLPQPTAFPKSILFHDGLFGELDGLIAVSGQFGHSLGLRADGTVWAWGSNANGLLGDGTFAEKSFHAVPVLGPDGVNRLDDVIAIAAGEQFNLVLRGDGTVWAWGAGPFGQLGNGQSGGDASNPLVTARFPAQVMTASGSRPLGNVVAIAAGGAAGFALLANGTVMTWGLQANGNLGLGAGPIVVPLATPVLNQTGDGPLTGIVSVAVGGTLHAAALTDGGTVLTWGGDQFGQLGDGPSAVPQRNLPGPVLVAAGGPPLGGISAVGAGLGHVLALRANGDLLSWGRNSNGELGIAATGDRDLPQTVLSGAFKPVTNVAEISAGGFQSLFIAALP